MAADLTELIHDLQSENGEARIVDIARRRGTSHVVVVSALKRLQRDGYVVRKPRRGVLLTAKGRELARTYRERHRLVRDVLISLGVPLEEAEKDAEGIEHHIGPATLAAFRRHLGHASTGGTEVSSQ